MEHGSGIRDRLNVHGAIDLETGKTAMHDVLTVDAVRAIVLTQIRRSRPLYTGRQLVHLFVDNAGYHHAKLVQARSWQGQSAGSGFNWSRPTARIEAYRTTHEGLSAWAHHPQPVLPPTKGFQHRNADLSRLRRCAARNWDTYCDRVTDNFRIINPKDFRVLT